LLFVLNYKDSAQDSFNFKIDFEKYWPAFLYYIGETYRRLRIFDLALNYFNVANLFDKSYYSPHLGKALVYFALGG
jgi:hypothetical protein